MARQVQYVKIKGTPAVKMAFRSIKGRVKHPKIRRA